MRQTGYPLCGAMALCLAVSSAAALNFSIQPQSPNPPDNQPNDNQPNDNPLAAQPQILFNRNIRPILSNNCFKCHGPDSAAREADLRLDSRQGATALTEDGLAAIVPGDAAASELIRRITASDPDDRMPPAETKKELTNEEIALLRRWIDEGAKWQDHWAFIPPTEPTLPVVQLTDWPINTIDTFVLARMEREGLSPSPIADRATLIRRLTFTLTGLPPTLEEIDAFQRDTAPGAYERVVDRLLASEHFGERMANDWLDAARYADTNGYHHDDFRTMWPWRDWVIQSFNDNKPYDVFTTEQLAGDLLENPTRDQIIATGFSRNHGISDEGGAIDAEYLVEYAADRVATTSTVFLGLTMECARCHDHKFDPISQEDYYSLFAFFNSVEEQGVPARDPARSFAYSPTITAPSPEQEQSLESTTKEIEALRAQRDAPDSSEAQAQAQWEQARRTEHKINWSLPEPVAATSSEGSDIAFLDDRSFKVTGKDPDTDIHTITLKTNETNLRLLRLDVFAEAENGNGSAGRAVHGNAVLSGIDLQVQSLTDPTQAQTITFTDAWANHEQPNGDFDIHNIVGQPTGEGWAINGHNVKGDRVALFVADQPFGYPGGSQLTVRLHYESRYTKHVIGRARIGVSPADDAIAESLPLITRDWFRVGPFESKTADEAFDTAFGPESTAYIAPDQPIKDTDKRWRHAPDVKDAQVFPLTGERRAFYFGRTYFTPVARTLNASLGSDDAIRVYLNGNELLANNTRRGAAPDQDTVALNLAAGENTVVIKIVNDGGPAGFYFKATDTQPDAPIEIEPLALIDPTLRSDSLNEALAFAYRFNKSPVYRALTEQIDALSAQRAAIEKAIPVTMVMKERPEPKQTYVLMRGSYLAPDENRPVDRVAPPAIAPWPDNAPPNRLGLAQWIVSPDNPLTARVAVNRFWQTIFGTGIVKTSENFGSQSEWPSHPDLLDHLAITFIDSGWNTKALIKSYVMSATFRQSSNLTPTLIERDPENRLLARGPRKRLSAEMIRDQALAAAGLLQPNVGGPPVKPYQPPGLWAERAIPSSNTKTFVPDTGDKLYRRSMYTFWKRSAPPPQMATFDAPEREFCVVRRGVTNTPLQALILMNDETYIEASRVLAARVIYDAKPTNNQSPDEARIDMMFRLVTARHPSPKESAILLEALNNHKARYLQDESAATALLSYGQAPNPTEIPPAQLAAYTMLASSILNLHETITNN
jgi:Protein of unknown function (DUF1553)/Protein of unknown function (DUF1549)/Planctomycete cytochrome C